jgi:autophagy-related protein 5
MHLPDGPVLQELCPPLRDDGEYYLLLRQEFLGLKIVASGIVETVQHYLEKHLPLLFGEQSVGRSGKRAAYILVQGVLCPPDAEMAWLGACLAGADGWVNICIGISRE